MLKQTQPQYKKIMLGNGKSSMYDVGCYLFSLVDGLNAMGWDFTPESFNQLCIDKKLFIGEFQNYIDVDNLPKVLPDIFQSFVKLDVWPPANLLEVYTKENYVVVCKVDARGIGGTGTHFVRLLRMDGNTAIIGDPWFGDEQKVTKRYSKYENILSLRVFQVRKKAPIVTQPPMQETAIKHFNVKDDKELIQMVERELQFLTDERKNNAGLNETIKNLQSQHDNFVENLLTTLNPMGNPLGLSSEELVKKLVVEAVKVETDLQTKLKESEKAAAERERLLKQENEELNRQLAQLQKDKDSLQLQLNDLQKGLDKVKQAQQTQQEKKDDFDLFREFVTKIKELVTSIKRK